MTLLTALLVSIALPASALNLAEICAGAPANGLKLIATPEGSMAVLDGGFCAAYNAAEAGETPVSIFSKPNPALQELQLFAPVETAPFEPKPRWRVRLYMSHSFTTYLPSDIAFRSSRYNVEVQDYEWAERGSREFFTLGTLTAKNNNPLQVFDEPTNTYVVSIEKNGHEFFLSAFHPKFLQAQGQVKYMKGTIDGAPVDGYHELNKPFDGYDQTPGESEIDRNENTYRQMAFEIGYGRRLKLLAGKLGHLTYVPGLAVGVMTGNNYSSVVQEGHWWEFDSKGDTYGVMGFGASVTNRVELNGRRERVGLFYENKVSMYKMEHGFLDGTQKYDLKLVGNSVGLKFMLYDAGKKRRRKPAVDF